MSGNTTEIPCPGCKDDNQLHHLVDIEPESTEEKGMKLRLCYDEGKLPDLYDSRDLESEVSAYPLGDFPEGTISEILEIYSDINFSWYQCWKCGLTTCFQERRNENSEWLRESDYFSSEETKYSNFCCPYCWAVNWSESHVMAHNIVKQKNENSGDFPEHNNIECEICHQLFTPGVKKIDYRLDNFEKTHKLMMSVPIDRIEKMLEEAEKMEEVDLPSFSQYTTKVIVEQEKKKKRRRAAKKSAATRKRRAEEKREEKNKKIRERKAREAEAAAMKKAAEEAAQQKAIEKKEERRKELENQREKNYSETGRRETDQEKEERESLQKEKEERERLEKEEEDNEKQTGILENNHEREMREEIYNDPKTKKLDYNANFLTNDILQKWMKNEKIRAETWDVLKKIIQRTDIMKNARKRIMLRASNYLKSIDLAKESREFEQLSIPEQLDVPPAFCIRTRIRIPFNVEKPYCDEEWDKRKSATNWDENTEENYCHFSGEKTGDSSNLKDKVSCKQPVMKKHLKKVQKNNYI